MDQQSLKASIQAARRGEPWGYESLLDAYGRRLYGYFYRATGKHHDAEDLLGEMSLRLVSRLKNYDDRGRFDQWLFRVAANLVRDRIRRSKTQPRPASLSAGDESDRSALADRLEGADAPVDGPLMLAEDAERLQQALGRLDETSRQMVLLRHFGEMSFKEIADIMDCPLGTALAKVHRALKQLRTWMGKEHADA